MNQATDRHIFFPTKDRSYWHPDRDLGLPLSYLAWGRRDFSIEFLPDCMHEGWVCTVIEEGSPIMSIRGREVELGKRNLVFIGPDCPFGWPSIEGSTCRFVQWMWNDQGETSFSGLPRDEYRICDIPRGKFKPLRQNHDQCRSEVLNFDHLTERFLEAAREVFEILVERAMKNELGEDVTDVRIRQAQDWMSKNLDSKEPIARVCDYLDISQSTLHRLFKAKFGKSAAGYFQQIRMVEAKRLLTEERKFIKETAFSLGYHHLNDFSRAYKTFHGCPPSQHQREMKSNP